MKDCFEFKKIKETACFVFLVATVVALLGCEDSFERSKKDARERFREFYKDDWAKVNHRNYKKIEIGMTCVDVIELIGLGMEVEETSTYRIREWINDFPEDEEDSEPWTTKIRITYGDNPVGQDLSPGPPFIHVTNKEWITR